MEPMFNLIRDNRSYIEIQRVPYEEPYALCLMISVGNGSFSGSLEYYCNTSDLMEMGVAFESLQQQANHSYVYQRGSSNPEDRWAYFFHISVLVLDSSGHCHLNLEIDNNRTPPERASCSFVISTDVSAIKRLGRLLKTFAQLEHSILRWSDTEGEVVVE
ncbi:MAG: hypothetical protein DWH81_03675 [Planctomycetota bacterium]|nr:MAG: hypothetical protein DWH81_03675 [Planctomycetota bacterium]